MKKFLASFLLFVILSCVVFGGLVLSQEIHTYRTIPMDITIVMGMDDVEIYTNQDCTQVVTSMHWGERARGSTDNTWNIYAKNTGSETVNLYHQMIGDISWGTITVSPTMLPISLAPQQVQQITIDIDVLPDAILAYYTFGIEFLGNAVES